MGAMGFELSLRALLPRTLQYVLGIFLVSLGIVLCKECGLGISPISSIPYALAAIFSVSFGAFTTLFHLANTVAQMLLERRLLDAKLWLQLPLALAFGLIIDWLGGLVAVDTSSLVCQIVALVLSVVFTALGMVLMLGANLVQNPPDGTVKCLAELMGIELGTVKVAYDVACVAISCVLGFVALHAPVGFGVATIISAVFVGKTVAWIKAVSRLVVGPLRSAR